MILADTTIWIDHLRNGVVPLQEQLEAAQILMHPLVLGEIAVGSLRNRSFLLAKLDNLPVAVRARDAHVLAMIEAERLFARGLSYVDVHLLASARLMPETKLWTRDKRLAAVARHFAVGHESD